MTGTQKTIMFTTLFILVVWLLSRKKGKAANAKGKPFVPGPDFQGQLFMGTDSSFEDGEFYFSTPMGQFTITDPDTSSPQYHSLEANENYQFGWQAPQPNVVVVTLLPLTPNAVVENVILNLTDQTTKFEYVQL